MLLRVIRGTVNAGREADFVAACREQVGTIARAPGLVAFMAGYSRALGSEQFLLATTWDSVEDARRTVGHESQPLANESFEGLARVDQVDHFTVLEPAFRGIVDVPGGVLRFTSGHVKAEFRQHMLEWLQKPPRSRAQDIQRLMLGWAVGERMDSDGQSIEVVAVSVWPSPLVVEAVADPGRTSEPLYSDVDDFASDFHVEQYRAISLELPFSMSDIGARQIIAARFATHDAATLAASQLAATVRQPRDAQISVAPLGAPGQAADVRNFVLAARVAIDEYARAERLISDNGGEVVLSQPERHAPRGDVPNADVANADVANSDVADAGSAAAGAVAHGLAPSA